MSISRRTALATGAAAITTAAVTVPLALKATATKAALGGDAVLLARVAQFHDVYGEWQDVWAKQKAHRAAVEAMPDCPPISPWYKGEPHFAFLEAHDAHRYYDQASRLADQTGALAKAIFETPAQTAEGALEKLKIAYMAVGDGEEPATGDSDLNALYDWDTPWMATVITDFERLLLSRGVTS